MQSEGHSRVSLLVSRSVRALVLSIFAIAASVSIAAPARGEPSEREIRSAWEKLDEDERFEVIEWYRSEVGRLETFQAGLIQYTLTLDERDPGFWPETEERPFYDPKEFTPKNPIRRKRLEADKSTVKRTEEKFLENLPERRRTRSWVYDWGARTIRRNGDEREPGRVFELALEGLLPNADLALAMILMQLDNGSERETLAAFDHAYTDRRGGVYPNLTLYDVWSSGEKMEMPDVDTLGLYRAMGGRRRFTPPLSSREQKEAFGDIEDHFTGARRYRALRSAMASVYLSAVPPVPAGYEKMLDRLHALWEHHASQPTSLTRDLPDASGWESFLVNWAKRCERDTELLSAGQNRRQTLLRDADGVRGTLVRVMREFGALAGER